MPEYFHSRMAELTFKHLTDSLTEQEKEELNQILASSPEKQKLFDKLTDPRHLIPEVLRLSEEDEKSSWEHQKQSMSFKRKAVPVWKYAAVALIIALPVLGFFFFYMKNNNSTTAQIIPVVVENKKNLRKNKVFVKRKNKPMISLDTLANGVIGYWDNNPILKNDTEFIYPKSLYADLEFIKTEDDGYFQFRISDGSKIWLCGPSHVNFSGNFNERKRSVEFEGVAYFEIAQNLSKPFIVQTNGIGINVLGTKFNVNSFSDDDIIKANLFEGKIKLTTGNNETLLFPGDQAIIKKSEVQSKGAVQIKQKSAGGFESSFMVFHKEDLSTALKEIARYYDCEIQFVHPVQKKRLEVALYRGLPLKTTLDHLNFITDIKFKINGKTILVNP